MAPDSPDSIDSIDLAQLAHVFRAVALATFADGKPRAEEMKVIRELLAAYPEFAALKEPQKLVVETWQLLKEHGQETLLDQIAAGLSDQKHRELAFRLAARVTLADGTTAGEEAMLLGELQERFALSPADVKRLLTAK